MRRDAGRLLEIPLILAFAAMLSAIIGPAWKPWGFLAGPALIAAIVAVAAGGAFLANLRKRRATAGLMELAERRGPVPPWPELKDLVDTAELPLDVCFRVTSERDHPAREGFALGLYRALLFSDVKDESAYRLLGDFVRERPEAPPSVRLAGYVISFAPKAIALDTVRAALDGPPGKVAEEAADQAVSRATSDWKEGHADFAALVRERKDRVGPLLTQDARRADFRKLTGGG